MRLNGLGIIVLCVIVWAAWARPYAADSSVVTRQDELQNLYQTVDYLDQRVVRLNDELNELYQWAKACEKRVIEGEKREARLEKRVKRLEGRLFGP